MASVCSHKATGTRSIQFKGLDNKRRTLRLGKCPLKDAGTICGHVQEILNSVLRGVPMARQTATWLADLPMPMLEKLAGVGLVEPPKPPESNCLGAFLARTLDRRTDLKPTTRTVYLMTVRNLKEFFGEDKPIESVTSGDCDDFRRWLLEHEKLALATAGRRCGIATDFFRLIRLMRAYCGGGRAA